MLPVRFGRGFAEERNDQVVCLTSIEMQPLRVGIEHQVDAVMAVPADRAEILEALLPEPSVGPMVQIASSQTPLDSAHHTDRLAAEATDPLGMPAPTHLEPLAASHPASVGNPTQDALTRPAGTGSSVTQR